MEGDRCGLSSCGDLVHKRKMDNSYDDSENSSHAVMHSTTTMSKLQSNSSRILRDLTNLPKNKDLVGSIKRSTSMPPPITVHCKSKNYLSFFIFKQNFELVYLILTEKLNSSNVQATKRSKHCNEVFSKNIYI